MKDMMPCMDELPDKPSGTKPRYTWPWFVLGAALLGLVLAVFWMSHAVRRTREQRDLNRPYPTKEAAAPAAASVSPANGTNRP